jgi:hypothetical protein
MPYLLIIYSYFKHNLLVDIMESTKKSLPLHQKLTFWYQHFIKGEDRFEDSLLPVGNIESV